MNGPYPAGTLAVVQNPTDGRFAGDRRNLFHVRHGNDIDERPRQVVPQVAQRRQQIPAMLQRQRLRILHRAHVRADVVSSDGQGEDFPIFFEVHSPVGLDARHHLARHVGKLFRDGTDFCIVELRVPVETVRVAVRITY